MEETLEKLRWPRAAGKHIMAPECDHNASCAVTKGTDDLPSLRLSEPSEEPERRWFASASAGGGIMREPRVCPSCNGLGRHLCVPCGGAGVICARHAATPDSTPSPSDCGRAVKELLEHIKACGFVVRASDI